MTHYLLCSSQNAETYLRYSNTLLVSLNNRIYFREQQSSGRSNSADLSVSKRVRATTVTSPCFAGAKPELQASKGDIFPLYTITRPVGRDISKGDATRADWSLVCAIPVTNAMRFQRF